MPATLQLEHSMWANWPARVDRENFRREGDYLAQTEFWGGEKLTEAHYRAAYEYVKSIDRYEYLDLFTEDIAFGVTVFDIDGKTITRDLLDSILEIYFLHDCGFDRNDAPTVLDIGAGYGRFAHRFTQAFPRGFVYCTDAIAESSELCELYLRYRGVNRACVIPMEHVPYTSATFDLAVNIHSWSECTLSAIRAWLDILDEKRVPKLFVVPHTPDCVTMETDGPPCVFYPDIRRRFHYGRSHRKFPDAAACWLYPTTYYFFSRTEITR